MSVGTLRGGIPTVRLVAATTGTVPLGGKIVPPPSDINYLKIRALANPCFVYFTEADYIAHTNYITVPIAAAATPHGEWEGPVEMIHGSAHSDLWVRGSGGTSNVEIVFFQRRG